MQQNEPVTNDWHKSNPSQHELNDHSFIMKEFVGDVSFAAIRHLIETMRDICVTTENVFYGNAQSREDLLYVTQKIVRFFEAAYAQFKTDTKTAEVVEQNQSADTRLLRVAERSFFKRSKSGPTVLPCITLLGKWLSTAGFHPGDELTVASTFQSVVITMNREWDKEQGDYKERA